MVQIAPTTRLTQTYGGPVAWSPWVQYSAGASTITAIFANSDLISGTNDQILCRLYWSASPTGSSPTQIGAQNGPFSCPGVTQSYGWSLSGVPAGSYVAAAMFCNNGPNTNAVSVGLFDNNVACEYGGQMRTDVPLLVQIAPEVLLGAIGVVTGGIYWAVALFMAGRFMDISDLCSQPRPPEVTFTVQDYADLVTVTKPLEAAAAAAKALAWVRWKAWPIYCECVPGVNPTIPEPIIDQPDPPGAPLPPSVGFTCDEASLCDQLLSLRGTLQAMQSRMQSTFDMVTLIQRQHVPFAYILGTNHAGLTGWGQFNVQGILGLAVSASVVPAWMGRTDDTPDTIYTIGRISVGTTDGWTDLHEVRHAEQLLLDLGGDITRVGYHFEVGVTASIRELVREP